MVKLNGARNLQKGRLHRTFKVVLKCLDLGWIFPVSFVLDFYQKKIQRIDFIK